METEGTGKQLEEVEKRQQILSGDMEDTGRESERLKADMRSWSSPWQIWSAAWQLTGTS